MQTSAMDFEETERQPVRSRRSTFGQCSAIALSDSPDNCTQPLISIQSTIRMSENGRSKVVNEKAIITKEARAHIAKKRENKREKKYLKLA